MDKCTVCSKPIKGKPMELNGTIIIEKKNMPDDMICFEAKLCSEDCFLLFVAFTMLAFRPDFETVPEELYEIATKLKIDPIKVFYVLDYLKSLPEEKLAKIAQNIAKSFITEEKKE